MVVDLLDRNYTTGKNYINGKFADNSFVFRTNAAEFIIHYEVENVLFNSLPHVGITAREGIAVMYRKNSDVTWLTVDVFSRSQSERVNMHHMVQNNESYDILIYGPMFASLKGLSIDIDDCYYIQQSEWIKNYSSRSVLCIGGVHTAGVGCTVATLSLPQIIHRRIGCMTDTLAFNKNNFLETVNKELCKLIENYGYMKYDLIILEGDYFRQDDYAVDKYMQNILNLASRLSRKVLMWSCISDANSTKKEKLIDLTNKFQTHNELKLKYIDSSRCYEPINADMCTFSNNYINDTARMIIFNDMETVVSDLLKLQ